MKTPLVILLLLFFLIGCNNQKSNRKETVIRYYNAFDSGKYNEIKTLINDSIAQINGDFITSYNHDSFYGFFKWDSIFKSSYEVVELVEKEDDIIVTVSQENLRNAFLKNNPLVYKVKVSFDFGKISKLEDLEYIDTNWEVWNREKNDLVAWIKKNHPDLDGFVNDMTMKGAKRYLKAIDFNIAKEDFDIQEKRTTKSSNSL